MWEIVFRAGHRRNGANLNGHISPKKKEKKKELRMRFFNFKIVYQNVCGLRSNLSSLYISSFDFEFDGIAFTETWLNGNIFDSEVMSSNFNTYKRDRRSRNGGGVLALDGRYCVRADNRGKPIYIT